MAIRGIWGGARFGCLALYSESGVGYGHSGRASLVREAVVKVKYKLDARLWHKARNGKLKADSDQG